MTERKCKKNGCKDKNDNCPILGTDELVVQCVGPWVEDKYFFLVSYLNASCKARKKFADKGNAIFIDLFSGPGKCVIKKENKEIDSGGIRALKRDEAPFNELFYFDINADNVDALKKRIGNKTFFHVRHGDANVLTKQLVSELLKKHWRYHFAFIDPFGPDGLKFTTLKELAKLDRMDMLIHFPIGAIKRNLSTWVKGTDTILDEFLGTTEWRKKIKGQENNVFNVLLNIFKDQLKSIGYPENGLKLFPPKNNIYAGLPTVPVKNTKEVDLYVLILASKNALAQKIWNSIIKNDPSGQKTFF
ncbi:MAG: three-Cys-motif partner protein TcmP [Candidatus Omnitrophica bacterium]|jgi:three-Cys-motif partner protein|nr:three-Cys-motif partner protein TcmP [Candidatus Omnitrophota bacterium]MDD5079361.1 three-Cys-motif partner protein TcmP [Candidatus Omnitrophota bacterium]